MMPPDWPGVLLHIGLAALAVAAVSAAGFPVVVLIANTLFWPIREAIQRRRRNTFDWYRPWMWSTQKKWEAWAPVAIGLIVIVAL